MSAHAMLTRVWLAVLLVALWAEAAGGAAAKWTRLRTAHFELAGDVGEKQLKQVGLRFEQFRETFARLFPKLRQAPTPVVIVVFGSKKTYQSFMPLFNGKRVDVSGYFLGGPDVSYITLTLDEGEAAFRIIFHEYTHLLVDATLADVPLWFNEGLAEYYSTFEATKDGRQATIGKVIEPHLLQLRERFIPLRELMSVRQESALYNEGDRRSIIYAESWALMHYLLVANPEGRIRLGKYLESYAAGMGSERAFKDAFGIEEAALERELRVYVTQDTHQSMVYTLRDPVEVDRTSTTEPMSEADGQTVLGDLLLHYDRPDEASPYVERALALEPSHVRATAVLGRIRHLQSRDEEALRLLADASARAGDDYVPHYAYASALLRPMKGPLAGTPPERATAVLAVSLLEKVVARQPDLADALALLGYGRLMSGRPVEALDPLVKAHEISPRQEYALMTAQAYVANRDLPSARQVLAVLAERGETPGIRQEARELLDEVTSAEHPQPGEASARAAAMERASATNRASGAMGLVPVFRTVGDGETREAGILQEIACSRDAVVLVVALPGRVTRFGAPEFINIAFINYRTDMTGSVSCGRRARPEKVYLTWRDGGPAGTDGRAVAVEFLPPGINP